ncbi:hypothetical protein O0L34_g5588 [Tuta absoluta]|nr:hypothetical protein O0L34_g5588 [Tuta absoluta]
MLTSDPFIGANVSVGAFEETFSGPNSQVYKSFTTKDLENALLKQSNPSVDDSLATVGIKSTSPMQSCFETVTFQADVHEIQFKPSVKTKSKYYNKRVTTAPLEESPPENAEPSIDESSTTAALKESSLLSSNLPVNMSSLTAEIRDFSPMNPDTPVNESFTAAAVKDSSSISSDQTVNENSSTDGILSKNAKNAEKEKISRDEEIGICLQEIREEGIKKEIPEDCVLNNIYVELELEEDEETNKNNNIVNKKVTKKNRQKKENKESKYQYIDFLSDDECFVWSSSS